MNRDTKGRFAKKGKQLLTLTIIVGVVYGIAWFVPKQIAYNNYANAQVIAPTIIDKTPEKIIKIQDTMLDELSLGCEVKGVTEPDSALLLDSNNQMSIGRFQFQIKTIQYYTKRFENVELNRHDAIVLALDATKSKELARKIIFDGNGLEGNWLNCSNAHQLSKEVEVIKSFMKI